MIRGSCFDSNRGTVVEHVEANTVYSVTTGGGKGGAREPVGARVAFDKIDESTLTGAACRFSGAEITVEAAASLPQERFLMNLQMTQLVVLF